MSKFSVRKTQYILFVILLFLYIYNTSFLGLPMSTTNIIGVMGSVVFVIYILSNKIEIKENTIVSIALFGILLVWSLVVILINGTYQMSFLILQMGAGIMIPFFGSFLVAYCGRSYTNSIQDFFNNIFIVVLIQSLITILSFFFNGFQMVIINFQNLSDKVINVFDTGIRAYGLGSGFDLGAFVISYSLLITAYLYLTCNNKKRNIYIIAYMIQSFAGILMARSAFVGIAISLSFILFVNKGIKKTLAFLAKIVITITVLIQCILNFFPGLLEKYRKTVVWIFEMIMMDQVAKTGKTTNTLMVIFQKMYFIPKYFKTWFVGDGLYTTLEGTPYMNTDPFYMRALLFFGVPGIIIFVLFLFSIVRKLKIKKHIEYNGVSENEKVLYNKLLVYMTILNLIIFVKLDSHCFWLLFYLMWFWYFKNKQVRDFEENRIYKGRSV